jgi:hypothetical protein
MNAPSPISWKKYFRSTRRQLVERSTASAAITEHSVSRGSNQEHIVAEYLTKVLPRKYSVGTGQIVCSNKLIPPSKQIDIVIYDHLFNAPLSIDGPNSIFPIEIVYGFVEVKSTLDSKEIEDAMKKVASVRRMKSSKHYITHEKYRKNANGKQINAIRTGEFSVSLAPRSFLIARRQRGWGGIDKFKRSLEVAAQRTGGMFHGVLVLEEDWYCYQKIGTSKEYRGSEGDALARLTNKLRRTISQVAMYEMAFARYLDEE